MFNKTHIHLQGGTDRTINQHVDIHEHRQSTSADAKLLSDLEKEAMDKVTDVMVHSIANTKFEFITYQYHASPLNVNGTGCIAFVLNGNKYKFTFDEEHDFDTMMTDPQQLIKEFYKNLSESIAREIMQQNETNEVLSSRISRFKFSK